MYADGSAVFGKAQGSDQTEIKTGIKYIITVTDETYMWGTVGSGLSNTAPVGTIFTATSDDTATGVNRVAIAALGGAVTAAGAIKTGDISATTGGTEINRNGVYIRSEDGYGKALEVYDGGFTGTEVTSTIFSNGNANFEGNVTASNVTFNLDLDNPNAWNVTEETYTDTETYEIEVPVIQTGVGTADLVDGDERETRTVTKTREVEKTREVREYVGETLDVKQTLLAITGALEGLKTAAETATTCDDLKAAIGEALAGIAAPSTGTADKKTKRNGKRK